MTDLSTATDRPSITVDALLECTETLATCTTPSGTQPGIDFGDLGAAVPAQGAPAGARSTGAGPGTVRRWVTTAAAAARTWCRAGQFGPDQSLELGRWTGGRC